MALDGFGLVEGSFRTWNLRRFGPPIDRAGALTDRLGAALRRHRPDAIVVGLPTRPVPVQPMLSQVVSTLGGARVPVVLRGAADGQRVLLGGRGQAHRTELHEVLARGFFPELARYTMRRPGEARVLARCREPDRYRRHAWQAVALALLTLAEHHPRIACALVPRDDNDTRGYCRLLRAMELEQHPLYDCSSTPPHPSS